MRDTYLIIEGAIGVGKTTLARMLHDQVHTNLLLEVFEENPFLAKFYEARARYAFQTQMFFLLSRYRQQHEQVSQILSKGALISDYMFAKDWLFAHLNLAGDEWEIYQQIHKALAEQIPTPDLIVYLQADLDVLMARIAQRDRPYERDMDRDYIESLRQLYEQFFAAERDVPVLAIDTSHLNFVANPDDFKFISGCIQSFLEKGVFQHRLLHEEPPAGETGPLTPGRRLPDLQRFHTELDRTTGFSANVYFNYLHLSEEMGELGSALATLWAEENVLVAQGHAAKQAHLAALTKISPRIESELADCLAYLLKISNYTGVDLEAAYLARMKK
jgi:deoxyguanosine kinase